MNQLGKRGSVDEKRKPGENSKRLQLATGIKNSRLHKKRAKTDNRQPPKKCETTGEKTGKKRPFLYVGLSPVFRRLGRFPMEGHKFVPIRANHFKIDIRPKYRIRK